MFYLKFISHEEYASLLKIHKTLRYLKQCLKLSFSGKLFFRLCLTFKTRTVTAIVRRVVRIQQYTLFFLTLNFYNARFVCVVQSLHDAASKSLLDFERNGAQQVFKFFNSILGPLKIIFRSILNVSTCELHLNVVRIESLCVSLIRNWTVKFVLCPLDRTSRYELWIFELYIIRTL